MGRTRRHLLVAGLSLASVAVAGCNSSDESGRDNDSENGTDTGGNGTNATNSGGNGANESANGTARADVEDRLETAETRLVEIFEGFGAELDSLDVTEGGELSVEQYRSRLAEARAELDGARADATPDQRERIDAYERLAAFFAEFVDAFGEFGTAMSELGTANQSIENGEWSRAVEPLDRADDGVSAARTGLSDARTAFEAVDTDALGGFGEFALADVESRLDELANILTALDATVSGLSSAATGNIALEAGTRAVEQAQWDQATREYGTARDEFADATVAFESGASETTGEYKSDLETFACQWETLRRAMDAFVRGSEAFARGDEETGQAAFDEGDRILEAGGRC